MYANAVRTWIGKLNTIQLIAFTSMYLYFVVLWHHILYVVLVVCLLPWRYLQWLQHIFFEHVSINVANGVPLMRWGSTMVWHNSLPLLDSFNKTELAFSHIQAILSEILPFTSFYSDNVTDTISSNNRSYQLQTLVGHVGCRLGVAQMLKGDRMAYSRIGKRNCPKHFDTKPFCAYSKVRLCIYTRLAGRRTMGYS